MNSRPGGRFLFLLYLKILLAMHAMRAYSSVHGRQQHATHSGIPPQLIPAATPGLLGVGMSITKDYIAAATAAVCDGGDFPASEALEIVIELSVVAVPAAGGLIIRSSDRAAIYVIPVTARAAAQPHRFVVVSHLGRMIAMHLSEAYRLGLREENEWGADMPEQTQRRLFADYTAERLEEKLSPDAYEPEGVVRVAAFRMATEDVLIRHPARAEVWSKAFAQTRHPRRSGDRTGDIWYELLGAAGALLEVLEPVEFEKAYLSLEGSLSVSQAQAYVRGFSGRTVPAPHLV